MKEKQKKIIFKAVLAIVVILVLFLIFYSPKAELSEELVKCIGENSVLYEQEGCYYCEIQKEEFGEYFNLLTSYDCKKDIIQCQLANIAATPSWVIDGELYSGVQELSKLKKLTGC